jgi:hypothetical protein
MKKLNHHGGIGPLELILLSLIVAAIGFTGWRILTNKHKEDTTKQPATKTSSVTQRTAIPEGWDEYKNTTYNFRFIYPKNWHKENTEELFVFYSPSDKQSLEASKAQGGNSEGFYFLQTMNARYLDANDDTRKLVQQASGALKCNGDAIVCGNYEYIGKIDVGKYQALEFIHGGFGANYSLLIPKDAGYIEIAFPSTDQKSALTSEIKQVIQSVRFY